MPEKRWMKILESPNSLAMLQACCPPAPPKQASTCSLMSKPRMTEISRMGRTMTSFATRKNPRATSSFDNSGRSRSLEYTLISAVIFSKDFLDASRSRASFSFVPNILGKYSGCKRPKTKLASVTAKYPSLR